MLYMEYLGRLPKATGAKLQKGLEQIGFHEILMKMTGS